MYAYIKQTKLQELYSEDNKIVLLCTYRDMCNNKVDYSISHLYFNHEELFPIDLELILYHPIWCLPLVFVLSSSYVISSLMGKRSWSVV